MKISAARTIVGIVALMLLASLGVCAQTTAPPQVVPRNAQFTGEQLDQILAPIALYPDPLLAQVLMAATYPLEIVKADRWLNDPNNAALKGDQLAAALQQQPWDPSVKSLVPFPQILRMMDDNLTWTEQLGDAFLAGQPAVMESIQRLRQRAQAAGMLQSTPQQVVSTDGQLIMIEPAEPEIVYVPVYDPYAVYGIWPYPAFPPYYFTGYFNVVVIGGLGYSWFGFGINEPLWGWGRWDWHRHRIDVDRHRFNPINAHHPPITSNIWQHDPSHRGGVPYRDADVRTRFQGEREAPEVRRTLRGYPAPTAAPPPRPAPSRERNADLQRSKPPQFRTPSPPPAYESFGRGPSVRAQSERGQASRQSEPRMTGRGNEGRQQSRPIPRAQPRQQSAPASRGRERR